EGVEHEYGRTEDSAAVRALRGVNLTIQPGSFTILMGPSGSGKSTLLNLIGAVERPTSGRVFLGETEISALSERDLTRIRRERIGFVFQFFNLIPTFTVRENVAFPLHLIGRPRREIAERVAATLADVGLEERASHYPNELSGGEMQRVAIGRGIIHRPELLIADEPTGNLDTRTGETILDVISAMHGSHRPTIVMATHSDRAAARGDRVIDVLDGEVLPGRGR
ncbi:MAG TPA: ABC transporter ATP-binding protein, partial [Thermoanaerobaculia bacterium]|nr:ABC transporter ATP-binding protein [Thermoanaerobaculia bacterium]